MLLVLLIAPIVLSAQSSKSQKKSQRAQPSATAATVKPISAFRVGVADTVVSPSLGDGDISELVRAFVPKPKGEFESTAEYLARTSTSDSGYFAVTLGEDRYAGSRYTYNADSESASTLVSFADPMLRRADSYGDLARVLELRTVVSNRSTYEGTNAYGAKTTVTRTLGTSISVASDSLLRGRSGVGEIRFRLPRENAPAAKPALRTLVVFHPGRSEIAPGYAEGVETHSPTRESPYESRFEHTLIWADDVQIWVVDGRTGHVLHKQSACTPDDMSRYTPPICR